MLYLSAKVVPLKKLKGQTANITLDSMQVMTPAGEIIAVTFSKHIIKQKFKIKLLELKKAFSCWNHRCL